jgi:hypothetical protein
MDPISSAGLASVAKAVDSAAAEGSKVAGNILTRLLGPAADVVGADWAERLKRRNLAKLLDKTQRREAEANISGFTTPRLAAATFEAAQYADDEIVTEYLSGVLSSSRAPDGGDDGGLPWSAVIAQLSTLQLRLHYFIYANARPFIASQGDNLWEAKNLSILMPIAALFGEVGLDPAIGSDWSRFEDATGGLARQGLMGNGLAHGPAEYLAKSLNDHRPFLTNRGRRRRLSSPTDGDVVLLPVTAHGISLFLWGVGRGAESLALYMDESVALGLVDPPDGLKMLDVVRLEYDCWEEVDIEPASSEVEQP